MPHRESQRFLRWVYRFRWGLATLSVLAALGSFALGLGRVAEFTEQIDSLADPPIESEVPRMFDSRSEIWFDEGDPALAAFREVEDRFMGEDSVLLAFSDGTDPHGVFSIEALQAIERITEKVRRVPYVRTVRSLTAHPWIRWGGVGEEEEGLIIGDLFEKGAAEYTERERLTRMVAVLGARGAAQLIGQDKVREIIGSAANPDDYIGEPRLLGNVLSVDGRSTAIVAQLIRPRLTQDTLDSTFEAGSTAYEAGPDIHTSVVQTEALHEIREILAEEDLEFHVAGMPVMQEHLVVTAQSDMSFVSLMFGVIALMLFILYRRVAAVLIPLATVMLAVMGMLGFALLKGDLLNQLSAVSPQMLIAIGVANAVHLVTAYYVLRPEYDNKDELVRAAMAFNAMPVLLTSATTVVGFLSLNTSSIFPIRQLGYMAAIGTAFAFLISMTLVPSLLSLIPLKGKSGPTVTALRDGRTERWSQVLAEIVFRRRKLIAGLGVVITLFAAHALYQAKFTSDLRLFFEDGDPLVRDVIWLDEHIGGTGDVEMVFSGAPSGDTAEEAARRSARIAELGNPKSDELRQELARLKVEAADYRQGQIADSPEFLDSLDRYQRRLEAEGQNRDSPMHIVTSYDSVLGVLRKMHQVQNENKGAFYRVPRASDIPEDARHEVVLYDEMLEEELIIPGQDASTMIAQYYLQFENGAKPEENLSTLITPDRRHVRLTMRTRADDSEDTLAAYERMREIATSEFPELIASPSDVAAGKALSTMAMTGSFYMQVNVITELMRTLFVSLSLAIVLISCLIALVFRSLSLGLVSMIPNLLPVMLPLSAMALLGVPIDGPAVIVCAVGLGLCVDDTVHFLTKYRRARARGMEAQDAIRTTYREVGAALTYTSIVLVSGFMVMGLASFRPNAMIGYLGAAMIGLAWIADFLVTPAVLSLLPGERSPSDGWQQESTNDR